jgi:hypothetical protein
VILKKIDYILLVFLIGFNIYYFMNIDDLQETNYGVYS